MIIELLILWLFYTPADDTLLVRVQPLWENKPMILNKPYRIDKDTISIQQWKCYVQVCALYKNHQLVYTFKKNHHLLDANNEASFQWTLPLPKRIEYDAIECSIGVDSSIQTDGVQGNDLDPEHDMYWSWQSGYIHTKLEATTLNSTHKYTFHIGGYRAPFNTLQLIRVPVYSSNTLVLSCPVDDWMKKVKQIPNNQIMRPCSDAVQLAKEWAKTWRSVPL